MKVFEKQAEMQKRCLLNFPEHAVRHESARASHEVSTKSVYFSRVSLPASGFPARYWQQKKILEHA